MRNIWCTSWALTLTLGASGWAANPAKLASQLPVRFEQSKTRGANFVAHAGAYDLALRPTESRIDRHGIGQRAVTMELAGANSHARMEALDRLPGVANYFLKSQDNWQTDVVGYARVRSSNVYPGVDLVFHGENGRLEYDFIVGPNVDPSVIRLSYRGSSGLRIDDNGDLVVAVNGDEMRWHRPELYQDIDGVRRSVAGNFTIRRNEVTFEIGKYDRSHTLVIDPTLAYVTYLGGPNNEVGRGIGVDGAGNVYIAGVTGSSGLPTTSAAQPNFGGSAAINPFGDAFVAKFSPSGVLQYLTYLGGSGNDAALALAVDSAGNAYIAGCTTSSTDFPLRNPTQSKFGGQGSASIVQTGDAFVAKLNPSGNQLVYSTYLGGNMDDIATAIAIDSAGNAYVAGATVSQNFPTSAGAFQRTMNGAAGEPIRPNAGQPAWEPGDAFVVKLNAAGQMTNGTMYGGTQDDAALTVAVDSSGNVYIGGSTISPNLQTTPGALSRSFGGSDIVDNNFFNTGDGFIAKFDPTLDTLLYGTYFGGRGDDTIAAMVVDASGNIYFTGSTSTSNLNTSAGAFQGSYVGFPDFFNTFIEQLYGDAYVAKINPSQTTPIYLSYLGGSQNDGGTAIAVDSAGNAYVTGFTDSPDFRMAGTPLQSSFGGDGGQGVFILYGDAFLTVVNPTGTQLLYSSYYGGNMDDEGDAIAIDSSGNVYIAGNTLSNNLQTPIGAFQKSFGGVGGSLGLIAARGDAFYAKFSGFANTGGTGGGGTPTPVLTLSSTQANFTYVLGSSPTPTPANVTVTNTGTGTLNWTATSSNPAIFSVTTSGTAGAGGSSTLTITVNVSTITSASTIPATVTVTAPGATNPTQTINLSLVVNPASTGGGGGGTGGTTGPVLPGLPHFAAQGVWTFGMFVINTSATATANFKVSFFDDNANPVTLPFSTGFTNQLSGSIPPLGSAYYEASNPGAVVVSGWGQINADPSIVIQALFREQSGNNYYEASVPSNAGSKEFEIPFDATTFAATGDQFFTGFAIANLDPSTPANITCTASDQTGATIPHAFDAVGPPMLNPLGHWAGYLFPALTGMRGTIDCTSNTTIAAVALRFIGSNAFSTLPVIDKPAAASPATSALPHFAAQDVWTTGFFVVNTGTSFANFNIGFFNDAGNPVSLVFTNGPSTNLTGSLEAGGSAYYETVDPIGGQLVSGWGQIGSESSSIVIQALFREHSGGTYYEAAVPSNAGSLEFEIPFDATTFAATGAQFFTGFAIANLDNQNTATITCTARDQTGAVIPNAFNGITGPPQLSPLGHWAGYLFPELTGKRGTIDCTSNTKIAATALRFIGSGAFSSFPVINK